MPKELIIEDNFNKSIALYKEQIGSEPFQPLQTLLITLKNLWTLNTTTSSVIQS